MFKRNHGIYHQNDTQHATNPAMLCTFILVSLLIVFVLSKYKDIGEVASVSIYYESNFHPLA